MHLRGLGADTEALRDFLGGTALAYQLQHLALAVSEMTRRYTIGARRFAKLREDNRRDRRAQILPPGMNRADRADQFRSSVGLHHVAGGARLGQRFDHVFFVVVLA